MNLGNCFSNLEIPYIKARKQIFFPTGDIEGHLKHVESTVQRLTPLFNDVRQNGAILDIGSGLAVADIFISRIVRPKNIYLLDSDTREILPAEFKGRNIDAWFPVTIGADFIRDKVSADVHPLSDLSIIPDNSVDLIVSFRAYGFHFPLKTYENEVNRVATCDCLLLVNTPVDDDSTIDGFKEIYRFQCSSKFNERAFKCGRSIR